MIETIAELDPEDEWKKMKENYERIVAQQLSNTFEQGYRPGETNRDQENRESIDFDGIFKFFSQTRTNSPVRLFSLRRHDINPEYRSDN